MSRDKRKSLAVLAAAALIGVGGTWSYLTCMRLTKNTLTVGTNTVSVTEEYEPPKELTEGENVFKKRVQAENTGTVPCFIRVFAAFSDSAVAGLSKLSPDGLVYFGTEEYAEHLPAGWEYISEEEDGLLGGFYYYTEIVEAGQRTSPLFEKVKTHFASAEQVTDYELLVYSESVQAADSLGAAFEGENAYRRAWREFLERR